MVRIGTAEYATLDAAIDAANDGDTIELLKSDALTFDKIGNKSLNFTGTGTITVEKQTKNGYKGDLKFDGKDLVFKWIGSDGSWLQLAMSGSLTFSNGAEGIFSFDSTEGTNCAIYSGDNNSMQLNVENGSSFKIYGKNTNGVTGQGIQVGESSNLNIRVMDNSTFLIDGTNRGYVNSPKVHVEKSTFTIQNCTSNASNGGAFTAVGSKINFLNNRGHGLSATTLEIKDNTEVICNNNVFYGVTVGAKMTMDGTSKLTANENGNGSTGGGLRLTKKAMGTIASSAVVTTNNNYRNGIENYGILTFDEGVKLTVMKNSEPDNGGGVYNTGTLTLPSDAIIYNNHAIKAGDDIYSTGKIIFGGVGSDWWLDGAPDCDGKIHKIDGWYDDAEGNRWQAHKDNAENHIVSVDPNKILTDNVAVKAAHGANAVEPTPVPTPGGGGSHYHPTTTPVPVIVIPPKTGDMTIWQSILHFLGIR